MFGGDILIGLARWTRSIFFRQGAEPLSRFPRLGGGGVGYTGFDELQMLGVDLRPNDVFKGSAQQTGHGLPNVKRSLEPIDNKTWKNLLNWRHYLFNFIEISVAMVVSHIVQIEEAVEKFGRGDII